MPFHGHGGPWPAASTATVHTTNPSRQIHGPFSLLAGKPSAFTCKVSTPRVSLFGKTVIFAWAFGRQEAIAAEAGTRSKLKGAWPYA
ncbi:MAG: hypothetical protein DMG27_02650 [Acidobacteria bacterium]|nr:MAG: hypothetical protein DMG27_02650 [Acidobacteriota bacterium]